MCDGEQRNSCILCCLEDLAFYIDTDSTGAFIKQSVLWPGARKWEPRSAIPNACFPSPVSHLSLPCHDAPFLSFIPVSCRIRTTRLPTGLNYPLTTSRERKEAETWKHKRAPALWNNLVLWQVWLLSKHYLNWNHFKDSSGNKGNGHSWLGLSYYNYFMVAAA